MALYSAEKLNFSLSNRLIHSLLVFTGFFILFTFIQFGIASYQRHAALRDKLVRWSDEIAEDLKYSNKWNLASFRNSDYNANHYYVLDRNGLIITIGGFVPELQLRVSLREQKPGIRTVTVPETGETWRIFLKRVRGGVVLLGVTPPDNLTRVNERLENNARRYGASLDDALRVQIHDIDKELDAAIIDDNGLVRYFDGGIPLKVVSSPNFTSDQIEE